MSVRKKNRLCEQADENLNRIIRRKGIIVIYGMGTPPYVIARGLGSWSRGIHKHTQGLV